MSEWGIARVRSGSGNSDAARDSDLKLQDLFRRSNLCVVSSQLLKTP